MEEGIKTKCDDLRAEIDKIKGEVRFLHKAKECAPETIDPAKGEMHANITLSYRHLEDARMRLGKVIQALEGGVSVWDK